MGSQTPSPCALPELGFNDGLRYSAERGGVALYVMPDYERVSAALIGPDTWRVARAANELRHALALRERPARARA